MKTVLKVAASGVIVQLAFATSAMSASLSFDVKDSDGKPLSDAVVFLDSEFAKSQAHPISGAEMRQIKKQFDPSVLIVPRGTSVRFPNHDKVRHHVYSFSPAKPFELKLYSGSDSNPVTFEKEGIVVLGCNIHDNMVAWIVVVNTPYYAKTDAFGKATLPDVPAGAYKLRSWHPDFKVGDPAQTQDFLKSGSNQTVSMVIKGVKETPR